MKKIRVYTVILIILIITAEVLGVLAIRKDLASRKIDQQAHEVVQEIRSGKKVKTSEETDVIQEIDAEMGGYRVIGIINIPKISIEYPILEKTDKTSLSLSITKFWGNKINAIGNMVLAGHNNLNDKMFGKLNKLENGDIIELTDNQMVTINYKVYKKYTVDPNDISCIQAEDENSREVTLITCTNGNKNRLIVKAREIK